MRRISRLTSIVLIVCALCNALSIVDVAALSETEAAQKGAEVFEAWDIINYTEYSYMVNDYVSPTHMFVENLQAEHNWDGLLAAWRVATFDGGSEVSYYTKEISYYEAFLFNVLYDESTNSLGSSFVSSLESSTGDIEKNWKAIGSSAWKSLCEADNDFKGNPDLNDDVVVAKLVKDLGSLQDVKDSMEIIGDATDLIGYCSTALEVIPESVKLTPVMPL